MVGWYTAYYMYSYFSKSNFFVSYTTVAIQMQKTRLNIVGSIASTEQYAI